MKYMFAFIYPSIWFVIEAMSNDSNDVPPPLIAVRHGGNDSSDGTYFADFKRVYIQKSLWKPNIQCSFKPRCVIKNHNSTK